MERRKPALDACIHRSKRRLSWVSGRIRFAFKVDSGGNPVDAHPVASNLGHYELEQCLTTVLAETVFPPPAGRQLTHVLYWDMGVDGVYRNAEPLRPKALRRVLRKRTHRVYRECKARRGRHRYLITAYVNPRGRILSLGAVVLRGGRRAGERLPCILEQIARWPMPPVKRRSKVRVRLR